MRTVFDKMIFGFSCVCMAAAFSVITAAQTPPVPKTPQTPPTPKITVPRPAPIFPALSRNDHELAIYVDPAAQLSLCVIEGRLKVNGWDRKEVRIFVQGGGKFSYKTMQKARNGDMPNWITAISTEQRGAERSISECLWGREIEIDMPTGASLSVRGQENSTVINGIRRAEVKNVGGNITISNVSGGVSAATYRGDVTVVSVRGAISLDSTTGSILISGSGPAQPGDTLKAKTNSGAISLDSSSHRQVDLGTLSGMVVYAGELLEGAAYTFVTTSGSIRMNLPSNTAGRVLATFGTGNFSSDLPFTVVTENISPGPVKNVVGDIGKGGDAILKLTTLSGRIGIRKQ